MSSNSYDYSESGLCAQLGWGTRAGLGKEGWREVAVEGPGMRFRSSPISHCTRAKPGPGLFLLPEGWEDQGAGRGFSWTLSQPGTPAPLPLVHPGEEYRPLLFYQETTAQILAHALNPLDYRKWRSKSVSWRALKVFKVGEGGLWYQTHGSMTTKDSGHSIFSISVRTDGPGSAETLSE